MQLSRGDIAVAIVIAIFGLGFVIARATLRDAAQADVPSPEAPTAASAEEAAATGAPSPSASQAPVDGPPEDRGAAAAVVPVEATGAPPDGDTAAASQQAEEGQPVDQGEPTQIDIYAEQIVPAEFGLGEASPRSFVSDALARLAQSVRDCPGTIAITGHTDASGDRGENTRISMDRARFVQAMLIQQGIPADRIAIKGLGGEVPIASNRTSEGRMRNRRVTVVCAR